MSTSLYDLSKMTKYELRETLAPIRDAVAKRVNRIKKAGLPSPALRSLESSGGLLTAKFDDKQTLISEIQRGKAFMKLNTSTIPGAKTYAQNIMKKQSDLERTGIIKSIEDIAPDYTKLSNRGKSRYWEALHKLKQLGIGTLTAENYDLYNALIRTSFKGNRPDNKFLMSTVPEEAWDYIIENSYIPNDDLYAKGKLKKSELDSYWAEKIAKMIMVFHKWRNDNPWEQAIRKRTENGYRITWDEVDELTNQ